MTLPKSISACIIRWLILIFIGFLGAMIAASIGFMLQQADFWQFSVAIVVMPLVETLVFNRWLQQGFINYRLQKKATPQQTYVFSILLMSGAFALSHIGYGADVFLWWLIPATALGVFWVYCPNLWVVSSVHAAWNLSLWLVS